MALTRAQKEHLLKLTQDIITATSKVVAVTYNGSTVADMERLRADARRRGVRVVVIKNRLLHRLLPEDFNKGLLKGQLLYLFGNDIEDISRLIIDFPKLAPVLGFENDGSVVYDQDFIKILMALPSKGQLISDILSIGDIFNTINALERR